MRILHVIATVGPRFGGPTIAVHAITRSLAGRGHAVTLATTDASDDGSGRLDVPVNAPIVVDGVTQCHFSRSVPGKWKVSVRLAWWLMRNLGTFDVVHVHGLFQFPTLAACRIARWAKVPYVLRPLGNLDAWSLRQRAWKKWPYMRLVERGNIRHAAALHATSDAEARELAAFGGRRVEVISLGVDPAPDAARSDRDRGRSDGTLRVLFLSRLHPKKEVPVLLEAVRLARASGAILELTICGSGEPAYEAELRALAKRLGLEEIVRWAGQVAGTEKSQILAQADVFVLPSRQENFGIAVAEALASGVPVIVSHAVAIAQDVERAGAGMALPVDASRFAEALTFFASDPALRARAGAAAVELARTAYSWPTTAARLEALYLAITSTAHSTNQT